jgi:ribosome-binding protein aMBF1 (putative translation factor)
MHHQVIRALALRLSEQPLELCERIASMEGPENRAVPRLLSVNVGLPRDVAWREKNALEDEFSLAAAMIQARAHANLTQEELAERMHTTQAVIARLESGRVKPSTRTLERLARPPACGCEFRSSRRRRGERWGRIQR